MRKKTIGDLIEFRLNSIYCLGVIISIYNPEIGKRSIYLIRYYSNVTNDHKTIFSDQLGISEIKKIK